MPTIQSVSIHKPCNERWEQMAPGIDGSYCMHCCKTVTDFTTMSNVDVVAYLGSSGDVCGRLNKKQLQSINVGIARNGSNSLFWKRLLAAASLISLLPFTEAEATVKPGTEQVIKKAGKSINNLPADTVSQVLLKGKVVAKDDGAPMPGVSIYVKDNSLSTSTDIDGNFKLIVPSSADSVVVSFIGFKTQKFKISDVVNNLFTVTMGLNLDLANSNDVLIGAIAVRHSFTWRMWHKIKMIF
ncbi:carboxypeptidase-like regulatory domain-containing protein [Mucilaginibacter sp. FT3.2]|uniref:carboxypeptidase-like regulatory domain-containing protein n=1 Tax=Mucilaginibacter sp. FT3.2 TaxID=2723090 RepID=UPI001619A57A|nr:carboxypeptidase-like regulatory domain-containing protein [Mucilaginibacter sp. FT3.2]MBB6234714.1 hypothetical protein [Mucilaginibacter sp. FT3.2]